MKFDGYQTYKETRIPWLYKIPGHWQVERAKSIFKKMSRSTLEQDKIITVFRDGEVTRRENRRETGFTNAVEENGYQGLKKGDLVFHAMDAFAGAIGVSDSDGKATPEYLVYTPIDNNKIHVPFYGLLFRQMALSGFVLALGKSVRERSPRFKHTKFMTLDVPIPPIEEQQAIASYLDTKTAQIDGQIDLLTQKAQRYEELKRSLINETVTRGLDKSVPMKDSGIEWIGEIPEHWKSRRLKDICVYTKGYAFKSDQFIDSGTPIVKATDIKQGGIMNPTSFIDPSSSKFYKNVQLRNNDIVISTVGSQPNIIDSAVGQLARINKKIEGALLNQNTVILRIHKADMENKFFYYALICISFRRHVNFVARGTANQSSIKISETLEYIFFQPTINEQKEIAHYLDTKTAQIDQIIQTINTQIEKLKELRKTLINDVVTGKIKVIN
ncbi:MAG: restriction endonuclease subunit S [Planktothrix sp.]